MILSNKGKIPGFDIQQRLIFFQDVTFDQFIFSEFPTLVPGFLGSTKDFT
jgi:hypothetical protein